MKVSPKQAGQAFAGLFGAVFLRFHRRGPKRSQWTPQSWAVLQHLEMTGPLTVTEAARHMERSQSVMSEIVDGLARKGQLARVRDARDRRRTLVWLTEEGRAAMATQRQVLCAERLEQAFAQMDDGLRVDLLRALEALVDAGGETARASSPKSDFPSPTVQPTRSPRRTS